MVTIAVFILYNDKKEKRGDYLSAILEKKDRKLYYPDKEFSKKANLNSISKNISYEKIWEKEVEKS